VTITNVTGALPVDGTKTVTPTNTTVYTLTATGAGGTVTCARTVRVNDVPAPPAPTCDEFKVSPTTITRGQNAFLEWQTTNATNVRIDQGVGVVAVDGSKTVTPTQDTTYTLTATGAGGTKTCIATVVVNPLVELPRCEYFRAEPNNINRGQTTTLRWDTTNATRVVIDNAIGEVDRDGSINVSPTRDTNYRLKAENIHGDAVCYTEVNVRVPEPVFSCENNVNFRASDTSIDEGDNTNLIWDTTDATSVSINNGVGSTALDGQEVVSPRSDTTYTLTAIKGSKTLNCPLTINVDERGGGGGSPTPRCELKISDKSINRGDRVTLTWNTSNANEVILKDNHGKTLMTTEGKSSRDKKELYDGEMTIRPEKDTTYTLTAERGSKDRDCSVKVEVEDTLTVITDRDQDKVVTGITLTQLPYTGFDAGPMLTMLFYGLLLLWALYLAYVLVIRRSGFTPVAATSAPIFHEDTVNHALVTPQTITPTPSFVQAAVATSLATEAVAPVVGYAAAVANRDTAYDVAAEAVEAQAHAAHILLSGEAMQQFIGATAETDRAEILTAVIAAAKATYPSEDGWVVLTGERIATGNSSLAEAIATGNIVAAYQLIGNRPMVALADAAAELDGLYRAKQGATVPVSALLSSATATKEASAVKAAIDALTSALDGTYSNEAEAVKIAILKSVKALS